MNEAFRHWSCKELMLICKSLGSFVMFVEKGTWTYSYKFCITYPRYMGNLESTTRSANYKRQRLLKNSWNFVHPCTDLCLIVESQYTWFIFHYLKKNIRPSSSDKCKYSLTSYEDIPDSTGRSSTLITKCLQYPVGNAWAIDHLSC